MRVEIKQHNDQTGKWKMIDAYDFVGQSIMEYMINTEARIVGGIYEDKKDKPTLIICNNEKDYDKYSQKGFAAMVQDLEKILNTQAIPTVMLESFPDSTFVATRSI